MSGAQQQDDSAPADNALAATGLLEQLDGHFDNLAVAATSSNVALEQLVTANDTLAMNTANDIAEIKTLLAGANIGASAAAAVPTASESVTLATYKKTIKQLQTAIKYKWVPGGFCSMHGWGVGPKHNSDNCKGKAPGHVDTATRANPAGPGKTKNKGWDNFLQGPS